MFVVGAITCATDDSKSSGSAPFSLAIFFRAGIILAQEVDQKMFCSRQFLLDPGQVIPIRVSYVRCKSRCCK